mgnify:CR=1 FL=1
MYSLDILGIECNLDPQVWWRIYIYIMNKSIQCFQLRMLNYPITHQQLWLEVPWDCSIMWLPIPLVYASHLCTKCFSSSISGCWQIVHLWSSLGIDCHITLFGLWGWGSCWLCNVMVSCPFLVLSTWLLECSQDGAQHQNDAYSSWIRRAHHFDRFRL